MNEPEGKKTTIRCYLILRPASKKVNRARVVWAKVSRVKAIKARAVKAKVTRLIVTSAMVI